MTEKIQLSLLNGKNIDVVIDNLLINFLGGLFYAFKI